MKRLTASRINEKDLRDRVQTTIQAIVQDVQGELPAGVDREQLSREVLMRRWAWARWKSCWPTTT